jgi:O-acetylhomoserine/O-acetylserine sulfhydrylase-like pyridoxal-dependent enzyme
MRDETIAIHGCEVDSTRLTAVPIYQSVAYDLIDAEHATQAGLR